MEYLHIIIYGTLPNTEKEEKIVTCNSMDECHRYFVE